MNTPDRVGRMVIRVVSVIVLLGACTSVWCQTFVSSRPLYALPGNAVSLVPWVDNSVDTLAPWVTDLTYRDTFTLQTVSPPAALVPFGSPVPDYGSKSLTSNKLLYTPANGWTGTETVTYQGIATAGYAFQGNASFRTYSLANLTSCHTDSSVTPCVGGTCLQSLIRSNNCAFLNSTQTRIGDTGSPVTMNYLVNWPASGAEPKAVVVLVGGGNLDMSLTGNTVTGVADLIGNGKIAGGNFIVRTAQLFADAGYLTIAIDKPSDLTSLASPDTYRMSVKHAVDILAILRQHNTRGLPVFIAGTSRGAVSAVYLNLIANGISVSSPGLVSNADAALVQRPVHMLWNAFDTCPGLGTNYVPLSTSFTHAPSVLLDTLTSGYEITSGSFSGMTIAPNGSAQAPYGCGPYSYHGYLGSENQAVTTITSWINGQVGALPANQAPPQASFATVSANGNTIDLSRLVKYTGSGTLTYALPFATTSLGGSVTLNGALVTYTPATSSGIDYFTYSVSDGSGGVGAAVVTVINGTPAGTMISVQPKDPASGATPVTIGYGQVTQAGTTTLSLSSSGPAPPAGYSPGNHPTYFNLGTTAVYTVEAMVCIDYSRLGFADSSALGLFNYENGAWVNRTLSLSATPSVICGNVPTLSTLAVFAPQASPGITGIAGSFHTLGVKSDGSVWGWGFNQLGEIGDGSSLNTRLTPVQTSGMAGAIAVAVGVQHSIALKADGTVWAWGDNSFSQLGDTTTTNRLTPVQVSGLTGIVSIAAGMYHNLAVKSDGTVWAWGYGFDGQLGDNNTIDRPAPVQVIGLTGITAVAAGNSHSLALKKDGTVWAWGDNSYGQLGIGSSGGQLTPVQVTGLTGVVSLAAGTYHSLAVKTDGTVRAWGSNSFGRLGDGSQIRRLSPVQVSGLSGVIAVAGGDSHSLALLGDGTVRAWGSNSWGQVGDNGTTVYSRLTPVVVPGLAGITRIAAGWYYSIALKNGGVVYEWGKNDYGQLGDGTTTSQLSPVISGTNDLTVTVTGSGTVHSGSTPATPDLACTGSCTQAYGSGITVNLSAVPATGYTFAGWSGEGCSGSGGCTVAMSQVRLVTALFTPLTYSVSAAVTGGTGGSISTANATVAYGAPATFTITPTSGYTLAGLIDNGVSVPLSSPGIVPSGSGSFTYTIYGVTAAHSLQASFTPLAAAAAVPAFGPWGVLAAVAGLGMITRRRRS